MSRNFFQTDAKKFQLSILKNKKVLFQKKFQLSQEWTGFNIKSTSFVYWPNFQQRFWYIITVYLYIKLLPPCILIVSLHCTLAHSGMKIKCQFQHTFSRSLLFQLFWTKIQMSSVFSSKIDLWFELNIGRKLAYAHILGQIIGASEQFIFMPSFLFRLETVPSHDWN